MGERGVTGGAGRVHGEVATSPFVFYLTVPVGAAVLIHMAARLAFRAGRMEMYVADTCTLFGIMLMLVSAVLIMHHVYGMSLITYATLAAAFFILLGQALNIVDHNPAWGLETPAAPVSALRVAVRDVSFVAGITLLISVFVMSLFESNRARRLLAMAYAGVESQVAERTASLSEANRRLEQEVQVRRDTEHALRLSEDQFRALVENSRDIILRLDTGLNILYANPSALVFAGKGDGALDGRPVSDVLGMASGLDEWRRVARTALDRGMPVRVETRLGEGGHFRLLDWSMAPEQDREGNVVSLLTVARDMTELAHKESQRRVLEEQLVQSQKLESVGRLAGGVAHDFNNLLQVIKGYLEIAMAEIEGGHSAQARLRQVERAARRATGLVRQLLAFSRRETMRCECLDLNRLVFDMAKMLRRVIGERYEIDFEAEPGLPLVYVDAGHMEQVLMNLFVNARDAMPHGGAIRVDTHAVTITVEECAAKADWHPGDYVETRVADSGIGMTPLVLERIFEPFFTTKDTGRGTGLGLAVVYGIVRQHGGFLSVKSEPGAGSDFSFFLPVAP